MSRPSLRQVAIIVGVLLLVPAAMLADVQLRYISHIYTLQRLADIPRSEVALILGASVKRDGTPSEALRDRVMTGVRLYEQGVVKRLLLTGDDGAFHVNEIAAMQRLVREQGIPDDRVLIDGHGYRTYESCKHAAQQFGIKQALVVTQRFHVARALYVCEALGIKSFGVTSDLQTYRKGYFFWLRDIVASVQAWVDVHIQPRRPPV